jgi:hypothetical protein
MGRPVRCSLGRLLERSLQRSLPPVVFFTLLFLIRPPIQAQSPGVFTRPLNAVTRPRYLAVCAEIASRPVIKGNFEQTKTIQRLNRSLVSSGNFIIAAAQGMVWDTRSPFPSVMAVGGDFIIQSTPGGGRSKMDAGGNETFLSLANTISAIFTGNAQSLLEKFDNFFVEDSPGAWTIGLIPREASVRGFAERIILRGDSGLLRSILLEERNGGSIQYILSNHVFYDSLSADEKALFALD